MKRQIVTAIAVAALCAFSAHAQLGANPRYIEEVAIGGGYGETVNGGLDIDKDGDLRTNGDLTIDDIAVNGGDITSTTRLDLSGTSTVRIEETPLEVYDADGANTLAVTAGGSIAALTVRGYRASSSPIGTNNQNYAARGTLSSPSVVPGNTILHRQTFYGYDGNSDAAMARIDVLTANLTLGDGDMPGVFQFQVTPDGSETPATALTIASTGAVTTVADLTAGDDVVVTDDYQSVADLDLVPAPTYTLRLYEDGGAVALTVGTNGDVTTAFDIADNGGDFTTNQTTFNLLESTATTVNAFGAATSGLTLVDGTTNAAQYIITTNPNGGTAAASAISVGNAAAHTTDATILETFGTAFTTSGAKIQDGGLLLAGSGLSGGLALATEQASADVFIYAGGVASGDLVATFSDAQVVTLPGTIAVNGSGSTFGDASTDTFTYTGRAIFRAVTDAGPMTATGGTAGEVVRNTSDNKFYGCTVTHASAATWVAFN